MKLSSILGQGRGKLGAAVFSSTNGQQVVRQYQPNVKNPNTVAQTMQRARFKLMTQIASSMAPVIAMPKSGTVSSRNMFVKKNMPRVIGTQDGAQVVYENLEITNGTRALPGIHVKRESGMLKIGLLQAPTGQISRVAYCAFSKDSENQLSLEFSIIASSAGEQGTFDVETKNITTDVVFYAYGMIDTNSSATAAFENYHVDSATDLAKLIATRKLSLSDYSLTKTRGTTLKAGVNENVVVPAGSYGLYVNATAGGNVVIGVGDNDNVATVTNSSSYGHAWVAGSDVYLDATASEGYVFVGWFDQNSGAKVSSDSSYHFNLNKKSDLLAKFEANAGGEDPLG